MPPTDLCSWQNLLHLFMEYTAQDCNLRVMFRYVTGIQLQPYVSLVEEA